MRTSAAALYRCPATGQPLVLDTEAAEGDRIVSGSLVSPAGARYSIKDGIADLTWPRQLAKEDAFAREFYDGRADVYDTFLPLTFGTFREDEAKVRAGMIDLLRLSPDAAVLDVACGTGRDSELIAARLDERGRLFCQDISAGMLIRCKERMAEARPMVEVSLANACHLPFPDRSFDAVYQFGGVGEFSDIKGFFAEVVRVAKPGARVVVGDESMPPWLRQTEFAKILTFTNPQYAAPLPLEHLPVEARDVTLRWVIGGCFFLIDFTVGEGPPPADLNFPIPGAKGGTHTTRYHGQLEGVTLETKALAMKARAKLGISMHDWLDHLVRDAARKVLSDDV